MDVVKYQQKDEFYSPFSGQVLIKAEEHGGKWCIFLQASNEGLDQEQEVVLSKALQESKDYYLSHGVLSWDHKHKVLHDPKFIIGEPTEVQFNAQRETLVKGWLYQKNPIAQSVWQNIQSGAERLGASVGGGILKKSDGEGKDGVSSFITKLIWDETALTNKPVNAATFGHVQLIPFDQFAKALMAGTGVDAATYSGGRALTAENMDEVLVDQTFGQRDVPLGVNYEDGRKFFDGVLVAISKGKITSMEDVKKYTVDQGYDNGVAVALIDFIAKKIPNLSVK